LDWLFWLHLLSPDCVSALSAANTNADAITRANRYSDAIKQAANNHNIDPNVLAAIGVREQDSEISGSTEVVADEAHSRSI